MLHEVNIVDLIASLVIMHNLCIVDGIDNDVKTGTVDNLIRDSHEVNVESNEARLQQDALIHYILN